MNELHDLPTRYTVTCPLGEGGIGSVYKVNDSILKKTVALKVLHSPASKSETSLVNEFRILSQLNHPHLIKVYDFGFLPFDKPYYTMELAVGDDLKTYFTNNSNIIHTPTILQQILTALNYLHDHNILHGDIKPSNIMITTPNKGVYITKLLDFGLATTTFGECRHISGTPRFIAPEIFDRAAYSHASDLYALGISFIDCLTMTDSPISKNIDSNYYRNTHSILNKIFKQSGLINPSALSSFLLNLANLNIQDRPLSTIIALKSLSMLSNSTSSPIHNIDSAFVGRNNEQKIINEKISHQDLYSSLLIVEGHSGIGKKTLINKSLQIAQTKGFLVLDFSDEQYSHNSLNKFIELLVNNLDEKERPEFSARHENIITSLIDTDYVIDSKKDSTPVLYDNIVQFLHDLSLKHPIFINIPDIERFNDDFIRFINHLISETIFLNSKTLISITRNTNVTLIKSKNILIDKLTYPSHKPFILKLNTLNEEEVIAWLQYSFGNNVFTKKELRILMERTHGLPFLIKAVLKDLLAKNIIQFDNAIWHLDRKSFHSSTIPDNITEFVKSTFQELSSNEKRLLQTIAFWNSPINIKTILDLLNTDQENILMVLDNLSMQGIVIRDQDNFVSFVSPIYPEYIIKHTNHFLQKQINALIAHKLEASKTPDIARIAKHFITAKIVDKAIHYGLLAVDLMISKYELYESLSMLTMLKKLSLKAENNAYYFKIISKLASIEYKTGLSKEAVTDYGELAKLTTDSIKKAGYLIQIANIYENLWGQQEKAHNIYLDALALAKSANNLKLEATILIELSALNSDKSIEYLNNAASITKNVDINLYGRALSKILYHLLLVGDLNALNSTLNKTEELLNKVDLATKKDIISELHVIYFYQGQYQKSKEYIELKISIEEETNDELNKLYSLSSLGGCYYVQGDFLATIDILNNSLILSRKYNVHLMSINILANLSLACHRLAEYGESLRIIEQANQMIEEYNISEVGSYFLIKPTSLYLYLGKAREEEYYKYLKMTLERATKANNALVLGHRKLLISRYHYHKLDISKAIEHAHEAVTYFKESEDKDDIAESLCHLSICMTESDNYEEAEDCANEAQQIYNDIHCEYLSPFLYYCIGFLYRASGNDKALQFLIEGLNRSKRMGTKEITWQIERQLGLYYYETGDAQQSINYLRDSIDTIKQIAESIGKDELILSYLSVPFRKRVFSEIKKLSNIT